MRLVRIREAKPLGNYRVQLTLTDGREVERDLGPMLVGPVFDEIRNDEARFREMHVEGGRCRCGRSMRLQESLAMKKKAAAAKKASAPKTVVPKYPRHFA